MPIRRIFSPPIFKESPSITWTLPIGSAESGSSQSPSAFAPIAAATMRTPKKRRASDRRARNLRGVRGEGVRADGPSVADGRCPCPVRMLCTLRALAKLRGDDPAKVRLEPWINHDLRRTVRSRLSQLRVDADVAEAILAHVKPGIRG